MLKGSEVEKTVESALKMIGVCNLGTSQALHFATYPIANKERLKITIEGLIERLQTILDELEG